jgi:tetratricopeptide (TPR) repeat protein
VQDAIKLQESAAAFVDRALWVRTLGEAYRRAGQLDEAERTAHAALEFAQRHGEQANEAWTRFLLGEIAGDRKDHEAARGHLEQARELAARLGLRPLVAQCHLRLAAVARRARANDEARAHLQTATQMFAAMDMRAALAEARAQATEDGERHITPAGQE